MVDWNAFIPSNQNILSNAIDLQMPLRNGKL